MMSGGPYSADTKAGGGGHRFDVLLSSGNFFSVHGYEGERRRNVRFLPIEFYSVSKGKGK